MAGKLKVCIIGAEGWGSAIAAAVSSNVLQGDFDRRVHMYVNDEMIRNSMLSEVINSRHENVKYLPGIKLPKNLIAVNDLLEAAQNADILIFSTPLEFVNSYCNILAGNVKESAFAVSMTKGLTRVRGGEEVGLVSQAIGERLEIPCYSMMSAHSAMEMAQGKLCEVTIGCSDDAHAKLLTAALQTKNCRVISVNDVDGVELCGTLTDVIALGAGFVDGLRLGENARVAAIHLGIKEMMRFIKTFFPSAKMSTFYESCGVANSVASSYVDKNATFAKSLVTSGKTIEEIEANLLHGRKILGPMVAADVNALLERELMQHDFPLFTAIHLICQSEASPELMLEALQNHPDLSNSSISHLLSHESAKGGQNMDQVLDQVANTLPKLRTALDKVLAESGNKSFKQLKVMDDWTEVNDYEVEEPSRQEVTSQDSSLENEEMPRRLSVQAAQLQDDIRDGNVQLAFKMDINEGDRHLRLLLAEERERSGNNDDMVIASRLVAGEEDDSDRMGHGNILDSSAGSDQKTDKAFPSVITSNDTHDVLDLTSESEPLPAEPNSSKLSKINKFKDSISIQEAVNSKAQENLIKSIRQTIQALGDKEKMEHLIAENQAQEESSQLENQMEEETSQLEDESSEMKSQMEEETSQLKSQMDEETFELNKVDESHFVAFNAEDEEALDETTDKQQYKVKSETENLKALMFKDSEEPLEAEKLSEVRLQNENDFDLDEDEPVIGKKDRTYTKEHMELQELLEWQKLKPRGDEHPYGSAELEDSAVWEENARLPVEHEDWLQDVANHQEAELVQVRAENKDFSLPENEKMPKKVRQFSETNDGETTGNHEWDWLMNNEKIGMDAEERMEERDETLSKSDQEKLDNLDHQLKEALQHDLAVMSTSQGDESKKGLPDAELDPEAAKRITEQPGNPTPTPNQIPAVPLPVAVPEQPSKQTHIREGTPQFQNQPGTVPQHAPQTKPPAPKEHQSPHTNAPVKFEHLDGDRQPETSPADQQPPVAEKVSKTEPVAKEASTKPPQPKEKTPPAQQKRPVNKIKQQGDADPADHRLNTQKTEKHRSSIEKQKKRLESVDKKISIMRKADRRVSYRGQNPYKGEPDRDSRPPMDTSIQEGKAGQSEGLGHQRRKVVVTPPFNPPINPRMRVPRPPFDGRDQEFHTMTASSATKWPSMPKNLRQNRTSLVGTIQMKHLSDLRSQMPTTVPPPLWKIPLGVPRTPTFSKILCALQLGLLASYLACCKKN
ncbi:uncharacterized protein LOC108148882 [Drosophila elegans]|uniref:uncharacterized protein LOC108148882 n=1 Tax=Drosophila elegans TaxID=30023 RepID=UPI0007E74456|nr:uncharacterized protein LOC108148882 [Drosophila elegans]